VSIFIQFFLVGAATSRKTFLFLKEGHFGRSRSSKVDKFGANRKRGVDFLLVCNSNFGPTLHRFGDLTGFMCSWPHPYSTLILGVFPSRCTRSPMSGVNEHMDPKLFGREIIFDEFQPMWSWYLIVTDRRTDRQTDRRRAISYTVNAQSILGFIRDIGLYRLL